jgi:hypothetical protein
VHFQCNTSGEGGAINNREGATLTVERSNFINNYAYEARRRRDLELLR